MAGIDKTNLRTMAVDIAKQLDRKDSKGEDDKIEASIWNEFVADKGGRQIKSHITLENAIKSITTYLARNAAKTGEAIGDIAQTWFNKTSPIEKVVTPPVRQVPENELPPQQFKIPEQVPEVKPLPYTEESLEEMFVKPGKEILEHREAGKINGETIALLINNGGTYEEEINPKDAPYVFFGLMEEIPNLDEKFEGQTPEIIENIYNGLIERAEELEINLSEETGLSSIEIEDAEPSKQIKICKAISDAIKAHDESAINEMNMYQSIKAPNPELAGKTIEDKLSGKTYVYDENGKIQEVYSDENNLLLSRFNDNNGIWLDVGTDPCITVEFDKNDGSLKASYSEDYTDMDGFKWIMDRDENGIPGLITKSEKGTNKLLEVWRNEPFPESQLRAHFDYSNGNHVRQFYDTSGKLNYYYVIDKDDNNHAVYRDNNGALIGTTEQYNNDTTQIYRNADGELLATREYGNEDIYKDADGNEITEEQFNELVDERLR